MRWGLVRFAPRWRLEAGRAQSGESAIDGLQLIFGCSAHLGVAGKPVRMPHLDQHAVSGFDLRVPGADLKTQYAERPAARAMSPTGDGHISAGAGIHRVPSNHMGSVVRQYIDIFAAKVCWNRDFRRIEV
jgi:hypothetical protein